MGQAGSLLRLPVARCDADDSVLSEPEVAMEAPAVKKVASIFTPAPASLSSLSEEELEELKAEMIGEVIDKIVGEEGANLEAFLEPEVVTAPYDPRFPNVDQARHCFVRFNEYYKCVYERGEEHKRCDFYQRAYQSMCPADWVEAWQELREKGLWTGKY